MSICSEKIWFNTLLPFGGSNWEWVWTTSNFFSFSCSFGEKNWSSNRLSPTFRVIGNWICRYPNLNDRTFKRNFFKSCFRERPFTIGIPEEQHSLTFIWYSSYVFPPRLWQWISCDFKTRQAISNVVVLYRWLCNGNWVNSKFCYRPKGSVNQITLSNRAGGLCKFRNDRWNIMQL